MSYTGQLAEQGSADQPSLTDKSRARQGKGLTMLARICAVIVAAAAIYIIFASLGAYTAPAHASVQPPGSSTVSIVNGSSSLCFAVEHDSVKAGTPVVMSKCNPGWSREQWLYLDGQLHPWGSGLSVVSNSAGKLALSKTAQVFTYGPGHVLTTILNGVTNWVTWVPGGGKSPWVSAVQGAGQAVYIFTKAG